MLFKKCIYYILLYILLLYIIYLHNTYYKIYYVYLYCIYLGPHLWHMDVPRLGVESELHLLACTSATGNSRLELHLWPTPHLMAMSDHLTHWARPGIKPTSSWILVRLITAEPRWELQLWNFWLHTRGSSISCSVFCIFYFNPFSKTMNSVWQNYRRHSTSGCCSCYYLHGYILVIAKWWYSLSPLCI